MTVRKCITALSALVAASMASVATAQTVIDGPIISPINGHSYLLLSTSNWTDAQTAAKKLGGNLATVRSTAEENWIDQTFSSYSFLWIGLYDPTQESYGNNHAGHFVWADDEPVTYTDWASGEPNDFNGDEYWTQLITTSSSTDPANTWNDVTNSSDPEQYPNYYGPIYGLVEAVPEPTSLGMLTFASLAMLRRRRP